MRVEIEQIVLSMKKNPENWHIHVEGSRKSYKRYRLSHTKCNIHLFLNDDIFNMLHLNNLAFDCRDVELRPFEIRALKKQSKKLIEGLCEKKQEDQLSKIQACLLSKESYK